MAKTRTHIFYQFFLFLLTVSVANSAYATPKNVIFMIGDGMGFEQVRAASIYASGEPNKLSFQSLPYFGEVTTKSANNAVTDSAAAGTALATGQKVNNDVISAAIPGDSSELQTLLEYFKDSGKVTGLVTTVYITHATPAAFGAHETSRDNYDNIADDYRLRSKPNILLGSDGIALEDGKIKEHGVTVSEFEAAGYTAVTDRAGLLGIDPNMTKYLLGYFDTPESSGYMPYEPYTSNLPHLSEMAETALDVLDNEPNGFFLMIEGGKIDEAGHDNDLIHNVGETIEFSNTVKVVLDWAKGREDTLIIVTADHETGGLKVTQNNGEGVLPSVTWSTDDHTGTNVPVYAQGENAYLISGVMDNTDMFFLCTCTPGEGAWHPTPSDGSINNNTKANLSWLASLDAVSFDIYFGTDFNDVNDANNASPEFLLNIEEAKYIIGSPGSKYPGPLAASTTYYWRVDEINDVNDIDPNNICKGEVWSFTLSAKIAWNPEPADGAENEDTDIELNWYPALGVVVAKPHKVYFGENYDEVLAGTGDTYKGLFAKATYDPGMLEPGKTYYWRIDEQIGEGRYAYWAKGDVWSFKVSQNANMKHELNVRVSSSIDDAEEGPGENGYYYDSSDLEMLDDPDYNAGGRQVVGVHFRDINIPAGATIKKAYVEFTCKETTGGSDPAYLRLSGNLSLTPESFGSGTSLISERLKTEAKISWQPEAWTSADQTSRTTDISSIIQELINQDGWTQGKSIEIIVSENEDLSYTNFTGVRVARSYDGSASKAPLLHIEFE